MRTDILVPSEQQLLDQAERTSSEGNPCFKQFHRAGIAMESTTAILGATGKTGREVLKTLMLNKDLELRVYIRSRSKLLGLFPDIDNHANIKVIEGSISDIDVVKRCLDGVNTIVFCIGDNENRRGITLIEDATASVLKALDVLSRESSGHAAPRLIQLSSSTWNAKFEEQRPRVIDWAVKNAFYWPYADLLRGQALFRASPLLKSYLLAQPGGLVEITPAGYEISVDNCRPACSYADLGAAMAELATNKKYDESGAVGISSKDGDNMRKYGPTMGRLVFIGLCASFIPGFLPVYRAVASMFG